MNKICFQHDKAKPHTALLTQNYLEQLKIEMGISYIVKKDIPVISPDTAPLDFYGFGHLKQRLATSRAKTIDGIWKFLQQVWSQIPKHTVNKVYSEWKRRLRLVSKRDGAHIENIRNIHKRSVK